MTYYQDDTIALHHGKNLDVLPTLADGSGIELNKEYLDLSLRTRLSDGVLDFDGGAA